MNERAYSSKNALSLSQSKAVARLCTTSKDYVRKPLSADWQDVYVDSISGLGIGKDVSALAPTLMPNL